MKKILAILLLTLFATGASAHHDRRGYGHHGHYDRYRGCYNCWVAPAIIGGVIIGGVVSQPRNVYIQPPVYVNPNIPHTYFCPELNQYYPTITNCPGVWIQH
jgi:hypothetical protein